MLSRFFFIAIAGFWIVMNYLLWQSQYASHSQLGSAVPPDVVWDKILTAPDNSSLDIYDHDKKIGLCHWVATVGDTTQALNKSLAEDYAPDGLMPQPSSYGLNIEGNTALFTTNHVRFEVQLRLSTNETWQDFRMTLRIRPTMVDIHAIAASQKVMVKVSGDNGVWQRAFKFSDLENPTALLSDIGGVEAIAMAGAATAAMPMQPEAVAKMASNIKWEAHEDWMRFGHSKVKVYRLETTFLGQHLYIFTSRVGEILWVEAPNKLTFRNEAFNHF